MSDRNQRLSVADLRAGRNNVDPPQSISDQHCAEAVNVDWWNATVARKRSGVAAVSLTNSPFTGTISSQFRHVPGTDETVAELWATDDAATPNIGRLTGGTAWTSPTLKDVPTGNGWDVSYASFNGMLYIAYQSGVDRLHCWDPVLNIVRRTGLAVIGGGGISAGDTGSGSYPATERFYRIRAVEQRSGIVVRRSEFGPAVSFTPSGSGAGVLVTRGTLPGEGETHWEVEAGLDGATYYRIATVAAATTTYTDSALVTTYAASPVSDIAGTYTLQKSYRYIAVDQGRLLGFGSYTSTDSQNNVEFSAVLGDLIAIGDGERVPTGNFIGLDENDSGPATALVGPINGAFFPGKYRQLWKMTPTGNVAQPYSTLALSKVIGPVRHQAVAIGEDERGSTALYFTSFRGPYRWGVSGLEYIGKAIEDRTIGANSGTRLNLDTTHVSAFTLWYPEKRQMYFWLTVGANNDPTEVGVFSIGRTPPYFGGYQTEGGEPSRWSRFTGGMGTARCGCLFSDTVGASMSRLLRPYIGSTSAVNTFGKCDTGTQDLGANYQGYVITKALEPWGDDFNGSVMGMQIEALTSPGVTITVTTIADFGAQTSIGTASLSAVSDGGLETRVQPRVGGGTLANIQAVQWQIGDAAAANTSWQIDALSVTYAKEGPIAA